LKLQDDVSNANANTSANANDQLPVATISSPDSKRFEVCGPTEMHPKVFIWQTRTAARRWEGVGRHDRFARQPGATTD